MYSAPWGQRPPRPNQGFDRGEYSVEVVGKVQCDGRHSIAKFECPNAAKLANLLGPRHDSVIKGNAGDGCTVCSPANVDVVAEVV